MNSARRSRSEPGADLLQGGIGTDILHGGEGQDILIGGVGRDTLYVDAGADRFVFQSMADSAGATYGKIVGFDVRDDKIDLTAMDADSTLAGNQGVKLSLDTLFFASAGDLRTEVGGAGIKNMGDTRGDGEADVQIVVHEIGNPCEVTFQDTDFIL